MSLKNQLSRTGKNYTKNSGQQQSNHGKCEQPIQNLPLKLKNGVN